MKNSGNKDSAFILLAAILLIGFALRIAGVNFGFPYLFHPDEPTTVRRAIQFFDGDFNPRWFAMPSLYLYLIHFTFRAWAGLTGSAPPTLAPGASLETYYLLGRVLSVLAGTATIAVTWACGKRLYGRNGATAAAALTAVAPLHALHSHYATVDVPVTLAVIATFYFALRVSREGGWRDYLAAGILAGISAGLKYNGAFAILPVAAAHFVRLFLLWRSRAGGLPASEKFGKPAAAAVAALALFLATSPYLLSEFGRFRADLQSQANYLIRAGHGPIFIATRPGSFYNLFYNLPYALGAAFWFLALAGFIHWAVRPKTETIILFSWVLPYFALISHPTVKFSRFCLPMVPFLALLAGRLWEIRFRAGFADRVKNALLGLAWLWTFLYALSLTVVLARPDARIVAKEWIEENIPAGSRLGMVRTETGLIFLDDPPLEPGHPRFRIERYPRLLPALDANPDYLIVTDFDYRQILRLQERYDRDRADKWREFFNEERGYRMLIEFDRKPRLLGLRFAGDFPPHDMMYNHPLIRIFKRHN